MRVISPKILHGGLIPEHRLHPVFSPLIFLPFKEMARVFETALFCPPSFCEQKKRQPAE
jgi:hypothetical protein